MNYKKIYDSIIDRAKIRNLEEYSELHHIIPKCIGGNNSKNNLVKLTPEEHYVAHQLLVKIYPNNNGLIKAALMMTVFNDNHRRVNNKLFGWLRRKYSMSLQGKDPWNKGKVGLQVAWNKGLKQPDVSKRMQGNTNNKNRKITEELLIKLSDNNASKQIVTCPHCNKEGGLNVMKRWHFNNCKKQLL
jgi:hypothetical protein